MSQGPIEKKTGFSHLLAAAGYSAAGARRLLGEAAFRHELIAFCLAAALFALAGAAFLHYVGLAILFLLLIAFEAINTAIEEIVDRVSPEFSQMAKHAKDLGSFAVFCLIVANVVYAGCVVISQFI